MSKEDLTYSEAIEKAGASITRFPLIPIRGVPLMSYIANSWDSIWAFRPDPSDLLIATYPKAGLDLLRTRDPPRVIKTHLPFQLVPPGFWENKCKVIYVARNAKDNMVSYYHFDRMNLTQPEPGPWDGYIEKFMRGQLSWGSWYDHVKGYWVEREKRNILYLFYEDMKENPRREVERIMKYMDLSVSDEVINKIVELTSFKNMKENPMANYSCVPAPVFDHSISPFMRKGEVGDWTNHFTPEQSKMFDEDYEEQMKDVNIPFRTLI
ncbi:Sulfotransferase 1C4 [Collichthys lucidus]|uniref:Sulfotransferase n=1 Tax=Collichthys lucidus TaxID=240159 RepID=A0A4V6ASV2_COLLU|nr:Sulfotransferase 1C4 [Collichthys lucidus]